MTVSTQVTVRASQIRDRVREFYERHAVLFPLFMVLTIGGPVIAAVADMLVGTLLGIVIGIMFNIGVAVVGFMAIMRVREREINVGR